MEFDTTLWRSLSADEFCQRSGVGPESADLVRWYDAHGYPSPLLFTATKTIDAAIRKNPAFPQELEDDLKKDVDLTAKVWTLLSQKNDTQWKSNELRQELASLGYGQHAADSAAADTVDFSRAASAFEMDEAPTAKGHQPSRAVYDTLMRQHAQYGQGYLSPYTTIVGPSGIGKSFAMKQLAVRHGLYVVYTNMSPVTGRAYPRPTRVGSVPFAGHADDVMVHTWSAYIKNQVHLVDCCRAAGLTAPGLFNMLTSNNPDHIEMRRKLEAVFQGEGEVAFEAISSVVTQAKDFLEGFALNVPALSAEDPDGTRPTILCFDEARALLDGNQNSLFRTLRRAAAAVAKDDAFKRAGRPRFFLVLLDTSSRISNFTPNQHFDSSAKSAGQDLYHPIHQLNTLDVFAPADPGDPTGTSAAVRQLFSYGRPLWGAFLQSGYDPDDLLAFATKKISSYQTVNAEVYGIAVLSFRMLFYVSSPALAEEMVASMMRYIIAIALDRGSLRTTQPSEPVLAFAASRLLQDPETRLACVKAWVRGLHSGMVNPGDIGEQVASLLLLFAVDYAACPLDRLPRAVPLQDILAALLGTAVWDEMACLRAGTTSDILAHGHVFFNHFVRTPATPTLADLEAAYRRGMALFLPANFPGMDIAIPVRRTDSGRMSLLLIQVKNRKADSHTAGLEMHMAEDLCKATEALGMSPGELHGTIGLVMCLRTHAAPQCAVLGAKERRARAATRRRASTIQSGASASAEAPEAPEASPELVAMAFGLDATVYPCLQTPAKPPRRNRAKTPRGWVAPHGPDVTGQFEMANVCSLLRQLLETWPGPYAGKETESDYAQKLLDPFFDLRADDESDGSEEQ